MAIFFDQEDPPMSMLVLAFAITSAFASSTLAEERFPCDLAKAPPPPVCGRWYVPEMKADSSEMAVERRCYWECVPEKAE